MAMSTGLSVEDQKMLPVVQLETPFVKAKMLEDEEMSALSLELARLTGTETCQGDIHLRHEHSRGGARVYLDDAFEFDRLQLLRLPTDFSGRLSWRTMLKHHCFLANRSESFYRSISPQQWLRTVVTTQKPGMLFIPEVNCLNDRAGLEILSNVVPRRLFLTKLEGSALTCRGHQCTGGFFPTSALLCGGSPPRQSCTRCALAEQLRIETDRNMGSVVEVDKVLKFWFLAMTDVKSVKHINGGSEGDVSQIFWRNGTFARKRFPSHQITKFNRELEVALTVSHPNIVHCFGCSTWSQSADCDLFMEVLEEDLESFLSRLEDIGPQAFSCQHSLELLLQVAEGVEHLHEKKFIHGDLKPGNILLSRLPMHSEAPFYLVKIADFGCSQRVNASGATVEAFDFKIGTASYTAPEVYRCRKLVREIERHPDDLQKIQDLQDVLQRIDPQKFDVYSFGVIVQNVVSGVTGIVEGTGLDDSCFSLLKPFIQRCVAQEPQNRPRFTEICSMLSSVVTHWDVGHEVPL